MEEKLKFSVLLSLKEMTLRRVAVLLWCESEVFAALSKLHPYDTKLTVWRTIEDMVRVKVSKLELPEMLTKQVLALVTNVRSEIRRWMIFHDDVVCIYSKAHGGLPGATKLFWTSAGKIDYAETVKELRCNAVDVEKHYRIACYYCVEDCIAHLWENLPEEKKENFSNEEDIPCGLPYQWPHILRGNFSKLNNWTREKSGLTFNQYCFEESIYYSNRSAIQYFSSKLTREEREASLTRALDKLFESDRFSFLEVKCEFFRDVLASMPPERQTEVLRGRPLPVFQSFYDPVWPDLLSENAPLLWAHLPPSDYDTLLERMERRSDPIHSLSPQSLREFLKQSPLGLKRCFAERGDMIGKTPARRFLHTFILNEDSECVEALFQSLDAEDRARVVLHPSVVTLFFRSILNWHKEQMVEVCLREAALSEGERERWKACLLAECNTDGQRFEIRRVFRILDESEASAEEEKRGCKRKLENCSPEQ